MSENIFVNAKGFKDIRRGMRLIYKSACYDSNTCSKKLNINVNSWEKLLKKIRLYLPENFFQQDQRGHRKTLKCVYDRMNNTGNYLCEIFRNKSFTPAEIFIFMNTLQLTKVRAKEQRNLISEIQQRSMDLISESTIKRNLKKMAEEGYLEKEDSKYALSKDIWEDFTMEELMELYDYLSFVKNIVPMEAPFYLLEQKLKLYIESLSGMDIPQQETFLYLYNNDLGCVLDNEVLLKLLRAVCSGNYIELTMDNSKIRSGAVLEIMHDKQYGEQCVYFLNMQDNSVEIIMLNDIEKVEIRDTMKPEDKVIVQKSIEEVRTICNQNWGKKYTKGKLTEVVIQFLSEEKVRKRVELEGQGGKIVDISEGYFLYSIFVRNPEDMLPWIRTFSYEALVLRSGEAKLEEILLHEWEEAAK